VLFKYINIGLVWYFLKDWLGLIIHRKVEMKIRITVLTFTLAATLLVFCSCSSKQDFKPPLRTVAAEKLLNRGIARIEDHEFDRAIDDFNRVLKINPQNVTAYYHRGVAYDRKGYYDKAIADYTKAIQINPRATIAYYHRGLAWGQKGNYDNAIADFTKTVEIDPVHVLAYHNRGTAWYYKGDYDRTCSDFQKSCELGNCKGLDWARKKGICNK
jgi:tetratricopeptide (TPR) repeat protein